ncbi:MAG: hypothetical protein V1922_05340 [bacterium]
MKNNQSVDLPLLFFSFIFFIVLFILFSKFSFQNNSLTSNNIQNVAISPSSQKNTPPLKKLDYNSPIVCNYHAKDSSVSAAIEGNSITATLLKDKTTQRYVVQGDCLYSWNMREITGKKECGIGNYISLAKQMLSTGSISPDMMTEMFQKSGSSQAIDFNAILESCDNVGKVGGENFTIPKGVRFE